MSTVNSQNSGQLEGLTKRFAEHAAQLKFEALPREVVEKAKLIVRDSLGNQAAASAIGEPAIEMIKLVKEWGGAAQSTVSGFGIKVPSPQAAMCNAMLAHGVELDDAHGSGLIKAGSILVPSVLALGETVGANGKDVIAAIVAGYDIAVRIAKAINPGHRQRGFHTSGTVSLFGAAAAGAKILGCGAEEIAWALGLAGMQAAGIQSYLDDPCMAKPFSPGKSAFNGTLAAIMASRKFSGPTKVLEGREGFFNAYAPELRVSDLEGLGTHFAIMEVGFKPHAACRYAHGPIDIAQSLYHDQGARLADVERVTVHMSELSIRQASKPRIANLNAAMGSTEFSIALALQRGSNGLKDYWSGFNDTQLHDAAGRVVKLVPEEDFGVGGRQAIVEVELRDGRKMSLRQEEPKGEPTHPMSLQELESKFHTTAGLVLQPARTRQISDAVMGIESCANVSAITALMSAPDGRPALIA